MKRFLWAVLGGCLAFAVPAGAAPATSLEVRGDVMKPRAWTVTALKALGKVKSISTTLKGKPYTAKGVKLWSVIAASQPKLDTKSKHSEARFVVLARGRDGYLAAFAMPELLPEAGNKAAFLVWEANGKPLSGQDGAFRLVVPGEKKPMRWTYDIVAIEVYDGKRLLAK